MVYLGKHLPVIRCFYHGVLVDDTTINAEVAAFTDEQDDERDTQILPRFQAGMANINAVMSSSFVIGERVVAGVDMVSLPYGLS